MKYVLLLSLMVNQSCHQVICRRDLSPNHKRPIPALSLSLSLSLNPSPSLPRSVKDPRPSYPLLHNPFSYLPSPMMTLDLLSGFITRLPWFITPLEKETKHESPSIHHLWSSPIFRKKGALPEGCTLGP